MSKNDLIDNKIKEAVNYAFETAVREEPERITKDEFAEGFRSCFCAFFVILSQKLMRRMMTTLIGEESLMISVITWMTTAG